MTALALLIAAVALLAAGTALALVCRVRRGQGELQRTIHDRALALDRRCDALERGLDRLAVEQRLDHLAALVGHARRRGLLTDAAAGELEGYVLGLRRESRAP
ncbi:MAG: hypothetical protein D6696_02540 [Acidobacteria bacterium]|nr:MAG: hypothetical protein D6696_02540 [Acidobacteriota bacterium]